MNFDRSDWFWGLQRSCDVFWWRGEAMELWESRSGEFAESWIFGSRFERALSFSITHSGCYYHCKLLFSFFSIIFSLNNVCTITLRLCNGAQIGKMLKPEKWQASFDSEGRVSGFQKALKLIILGVCHLIVLSIH